MTNLRSNSLAAIGVSAINYEGKEDGMPHQIHEVPSSLGDLVRRIYNTFKLCLIIINVIMYPFEYET